MKRYSLVVLAAAFGLVVAAPAAGSTDIHSPKAQVSTKKAPTAYVSKKLRCKKGYKKVKRHGKYKCVKKKPYVPPAPLALTESEVKSQVNQKAYQYCQNNPPPPSVTPPADCVNSGIYVDYTGQIACDSKSTYSWSCYGWNDYLGDLIVGHPYTAFTCDFREIVERDGYNGIKSHQDPSFGSGGWDCLLVSTPL